MPDFYNKNITNNTNFKKTNLNPQDIKSDFPILNNSLAKEINHLNPPDRYKNFYLSKVFLKMSFLIKINGHMIVAWYIISKEGVEIIGHLATNI